MKISKKNSLPKKTKEIPLLNGIFLGKVENSLKESEKSLSLYYFSA